MGDLGPGWAGLGARLKRAWGETRLCCALYLVNGLLDRPLGSSRGGHEVDRM